MSRTSWQNMGKGSHDHVVANSSNEVKNTSHVAAQHIHEDLKEEKGLCIGQIIKRIVEMIPEKTAKNNKRFFRYFSNKS